MRHRFLSESVNVVASLYLLHLFLSPHLNLAAERLEKQFVLSDQ